MVETHVYIMTLKLCFHQILCKYSDVLQLIFTLHLTWMHTWQKFGRQNVTFRLPKKVSLKYSSDIISSGKWITHMLGKRLQIKPACRQLTFLIWVIQLWFKQEFTQCSSYFKDLIAFSVIQIACRHRMVCLRTGPYLDFRLCSSQPEKPGSSSWDPLGYQQVCFCLL